MTTRRTVGAFPRIRVFISLIDLQWYSLSNMVFEFGLGVVYKRSKRMQNSEKGLAVVVRPWAKLCLAQGCTFRMVVVAAPTD